jgi:predicted unusual protein kinase regulating ubiquinone biosynthesis (AarF/ABC1/UbiB family)
VTKDGREVAVKVQYPDIAHALKADLDNLGAMVSVVAASTRMVQGKSYFAELRESMMDELDYRQEAARALEFEAAVKALPDLKVPHCLLELTSEKVLTLELLHGPTLKEFLHDPKAAHSNEERYRVSRLLVRAVWGPLLVSGIIHADPHPGNFMLLPDGRVGVLDFGAIKRFSPAWVDVNRRLFARVVRDEPIDVIALSIDCGFTFDAPENARDFVQSVLDIATRPPRSRDFDFSKAFISRDMRNLFLKHAPRLGSIKPPKESVQFYRAVGGLSQNLETIAAVGDFKGIYEEMLALVP